MDALRSIYEKKGCGVLMEPNSVQKSILLWTFQSSSFATRVKGVVGEDWENKDDPFTPIIHHIFNKNTITAPLLW